MGTSLMPPGGLCEALPAGGWKALRLTLHSPAPIAAHRPASANRRWSSSTCISSARIFCTSSYRCSWLRASRLSIKSSFSLSASLRFSTWLSITPNSLWRVLPAGDRPRGGLRRSTAALAIHSEHKEVLRAFKILTRSQLKKALTPFGKKALTLLDSLARAQEA